MFEPRADLCPAQAIWQIVAQSRGGRVWGGRRLQPGQQSVEAVGGEFFGGEVFNEQAANVFVGEQACATVCTDRQVRGHHKAKGRVESPRRMGQEDVITDVMAGGSVWNRDVQQISKIRKH